MSSGKGWFAVLESTAIVLLAPVRQFLLVVWFAMLGRFEEAMSLMRKP